MKKVFLFVLSCIAFTAIHSQDKRKEKNNEEKHYPVSGGVLGAADFSRFRNSDETIDYDFRPGWSIGAWLNLPVAKVFSIEPQVLYSSLGYRSNSVTPVLLNNGEVKYIS